MTSAQSFLSLNQLAARLGLPAAWLKAEADARRIPSLHAGRRQLFHIESVTRALLTRTECETREVCHAG